MVTQTSKLKSSISRSLRKARSSSGLSIEDNHHLVAVPPDGGWGWVIVAASFIMMFFVDGIVYAFAVFFIDVSQTMECSVTDVAVVSSVLGGFYFLAGPLTCAAINRFGFQIIAFLGGSLGTIALLVSSYMTKLVPFIVIMGVLGGTALNMIYTPVLVAIGFYFEKWRALAMSIVCCGTSLGVSCMPILMNQLLSDIHWKLKFKYLSGVFCFCGFLGLTLKPLKTFKIEKTVQWGSVAQEAYEEEDHIPSDIWLPGRVTELLKRLRNTLFPTVSETSIFPDYQGQEYSLQESFAFSFLHRPEDEQLSTYVPATTPTGRSSVSTYSSYASGHGTSLSGRGRLRRDSFDSSEGSRQGTAGRLQKLRRSCKKCCSRHCCYRCCKPISEVTLHTNFNRPLYRDDIFYGSSLQRLPQYQRAIASSRHTTRNSVHPIPSLAFTLSVSRAPTGRDLHEDFRCVCCPEAFLRVLVTMLDFKMLKSPTFLIILISGYLTQLGTYISYTYITTYAEKKGVNREFAVMLLSIVGVANTFGRAACGLISCIPSVDINIISYLTIFASGASLIFFVFVNTALLLAVACSVFAFNLASFAVLRAVVFVDLFGLNNLTSCYGLNMVGQALAAFSATPIANLILRHTGEDFALVFHFTGFIIILSGVMLVPIKCILRCERKRGQ